MPGKIDVQTKITDANRAFDLVFQIAHMDKSGEPLSEIAIYKKEFKERIELLRINGWIVVADDIESMVVFNYD